MAKKKIETNKSTSVKTEKKDGTLLNISSLSILDLVCYLYATENICSIYEKNCRMNIGTYDNISKNDIVNSTKKLNFFNEKYEKIINELEKRLENLC